MSNDPATHPQVAESTDPDRGKVAQTSQGDATGLPNQPPTVQHPTG
ncbi:hypothetical protein C7460_104324 [Marinoscillum furvescens DSM 4134]|uniref:Uncharacterized protein n=1 Tax=Marinoscillum furvescens DSM 4134 TaxID=1122208 RepID=A0A3D9L855_MARFU|nr:hypothetical protein C7460_104324 [Marinoscillum furvescens DSM 4134]